MSLIIRPTYSSVYSNNKIRLLNRKTFVVAGVSIPMLYIPPGHFTAGAGLTFDPDKLESDEQIKKIVNKRKRRVFVKKGFYISETPVDMALFSLAFTGFREHDRRYYKHPVKIMWGSAAALCNRLSKLSGLAPSFTQTDILYDLVGVNSKNSLIKFTGVGNGKEDYLNSEGWRLPTMSEAFLFYFSIGGMTSNKLTEDYSKIINNSSERHASNSPIGGFWCYDTIPLEYQEAISFIYNTVNGHKDLRYLPMVSDRGGLQDPFYIIGSSSSRRAVCNFRNTLFCPTVDFNETRRYYEFSTNFLYSSFAELLPEKMLCNDSTRYAPLVTEHVHLVKSE